MFSFDQFSWISNSSNPVILFIKKDKGWSRTRAKGTHTAGAYPGFRSMKQLRALLLPSGWDASPLQGYPPAVCCRYPLHHTHTPGWRETTWGKVSCLRKQHDGRDWGLNHWRSDLKSNALTTTPPRPHFILFISIDLFTWFPMINFTWMIGYTGQWMSVTC